MGFIPGVSASDTLNRSVHGFVFGFKTDLSPSNISSYERPGYVYFSTSTSINSIYTLHPHWAIEIPLMMNNSTYRSGDFALNQNSADDYYIKTWLTDFRSGALLQYMIKSWRISLGSYAGWSLYEKTQVFKAQAARGRPRGIAHTDPLFAPCLKIGNYRQLSNGELISFGVSVCYTNFLVSFYPKPDVLSAGIEVGWYVRQKRSDSKRAGA